MPATHDTSVNRGQGQGYQSMQRGQCYQNVQMGQDQGYPNFQRGQGYRNALFAHNDNATHNLNC